MNNRLTVAAHATICAGLSFGQFEECSNGLLNLFRKVYPKRLITKSKLLNRIQSYILVT